MAIEKIKILGAVLELNSSAHPAHLPQKRAKWAELAVLFSSKTAPRILMFSMAMGADYAFELILSKTCAPPI